VKPRTKQQICKEVVALIDSEVESRLTARAGELEPLKNAVRELGYENDKLKRELRVARQDLQKLQDHIDGCLT